jgi:hypothetical protein
MRDWQKIEVQKLIIGYKILKSVPVNYSSGYILRIIQQIESKFWPLFFCIEKRTSILQVNYTTIQIRSNFIVILQHIRLNQKKGVKTAKQFPL